MKTHIIKIGNSQGIRIPKLLLKQCHLDREVEIEPHQGELIIRSCEPPRTHWKEAFKRMAENKDDQFIKGFPVPSAWRKEWVWQ